MRLVNGCKDTQISFNFDNNGNGDYTDPGEDYNNSASPEDLSCHVFHPNGGNLSRPTLDIDMYDPSLIGHSSGALSQGSEFYSVSCVTNVGTHPSGGDSCNTASIALENADLIMLVPYIREDVCKAINYKISGSKTIYTSADNLTWGNRFSGVYGQTAHISGLPGSTMSGCVTTTKTPPARITNGEYTFFHVLIPR